MDREQVLRFIENQRAMNRMVEAERRAMTTEQRAAETMRLFRLEIGSPDSGRDSRITARRERERMKILAEWAKIKKAYGIERASSSGD
jgi:hypothetical protein